MVTIVANIRLGEMVARELQLRPHSYRIASTLDHVRGGLRPRDVVIVVTDAVCTSHSGAEVVSYARHVAGCQVLEVSLDRLLGVDRDRRPGYAQGK